MKLGFDKRGYNLVHISNSDRRITVRVSRLVLEVFVGPCPPGMESCHDNGIRTDNRKSNLRWDTHQANMDDRERHGTVPRGERTGTSRTNAEAAEIHGLIACGMTVNQVAKQTGASVQVVRAIGNGKSWLSVTGGSARNLLAKLKGKV